MRARAILLSALLLSCAGTREDEALVVVQVFAATDVPPFDHLRFSVPDRDGVAPHLVAAPERELKFGYYLPGPNGPLVVTAEALDGDCVVGAGMTDVTVTLGQVAAPVPLALSATVRDCGAPDAAVDAPVAPEDAAGVDASYDAVIPDGPTLDAPATLDATPDAIVRRDAAPDAAPKPMCLPPVTRCTSSAACCTGLTCGTNSRGLVCCAQFAGACKNSLDCCGDFDCIKGGCCLQALTTCTNGGCCAGLTCGMSSAGHVCCGGVGTPCATVNGADCCGKLLCNQATHKCVAP